ncbi:hypothetical protein EV421DRAFT_1803326 [Armillaria borealis]|uniref:Secreted protein n=1 Tax=Armillaria borealis TaxID=47425 RepID=A0AA39JNP7_9AGAR|nr:hypothetical protein EV421DRAFT_1803326 [Armillaria borealis]
MGGLDACADWCLHFVFMGLTTAVACSESPFLVNGSSLDAGEGSVLAFPVFLDGHHAPAGCRTIFKMVLDIDKARGLDGYERHPE